MSDEYAPFPLAAAIERWSKLPAAGRPYVYGYVAKAVADLDRALAQAEHFNRVADPPSRPRGLLRLVSAREA